MPTRSLDARKAFLRFREGRYSHHLCIIVRGRLDLNLQTSRSRGARELTADDDIFESSSDGAVAFRVERGFVTGLEPLGTLRISDKSFSCLFGVVPISLGELVTCHAKFTALADRNDVALGIDNFCTSMRQHLSHGSQPRVDAVGSESIEAGWRGFRESCSGQPKAKCIISKAAIP